MTDQSKEIERLTQILSRLDVTIFKSSDGRFTVSTTVEPLFCFVRPSLEEINKVVIDTLQSYIDNFHDIGLFQIKIEKEELTPPLRQERSELVGRLRPFLSGSAET